MKLLLVLVASLCAVHAQAQVNKCTGADGKVTYSSAPCVGGKAQTVDIPLAYPPTARGAAPTSNGHLTELNNRIADALKRDDFATARRLAVTDEHHRVIAEVEQIVREERAAARAEKRARRPLVCVTMGQSNGSVDAQTRYGFGRATTSGTYSGNNTSTMVCNK